MSATFFIPRSRCAVLSDPDLRQEIQSHTGNALATESILRSLARFGGDGSIQSYEVIAQPSRRTQRADNPHTWMVHAVR